MNVHSADNSYEVKGPQIFTTAESTESAYFHSFFWFFTVYKISLPHLMLAM